MADLKTSSALSIESVSVLDERIGDFALSEIQSIVTSELPTIRQFRDFRLFRRAAPR
jgi:hypothetical protein